MPVSVTTRRNRIRATVRMPRKLYDEARNFVTKEASPADNINDFFVNAICAYVNLLKRKQIDYRFGKMADDVNYQKEAMLISEEFSQSDWEALELLDEESIEA